MMHLAMPQDPGVKIRHQPALDGLRAVAVGAVIAYHFGLGWLPGGFLGVDTFFVLSGYLITSLLLVEFAGARRIDLPGFWARRARRLLPALFLVLTAVALWAGLALAPDQLGAVRGDGIATLFYGANWRFIGSGQSYFATVSLPSPLRHAWSLAIEEQFYLIWPLVVAACLRVGRGRARGLAALCAVGALASIGAMALLYDPSDSSRAYFGTDTRAHALLIGALLAIVVRRFTVRPGGSTTGARAVPPDRRAATLLVPLLGIVSAAACVAAFALVPDGSPAMYRGGFAMFAVAVAVLIATMVAPAPSPVRGVLSAPPLVWVGRISYGLYLWHWPVQVALTGPHLGIDGAALALVRVGATVALATVSFYCVEQPIRRGALGRRWRPALAPVAAAGVAGLLIASTAGATPPPAYLRNEGQRGIDRALARLAAPGGRAADGVSRGSSPDPAGPAPAVPGAALAATPAPVPATVTFAPHRLLAVGDSLLSSLLPTLEPGAAARGLDFESIAIPGCGVFTGEPLAPDDSHLSWPAKCGTAMVELQLTAVQRTRPDLVIWLSSWETADRIVDGNFVQMDSPAGVDTTMRLMDEAVTRLTSTGARVALLTIAPTTWSPDYGSPTPEATRRVQLLNRLLRRYASEHPDRAFVVPLDQKVCPSGPPCPGVVDGVQVRNQDGRHYSPAGGAWLSQWLFDELVTPRVLPART
jgi:peptidoglycan/LPS O-acetylase OafA/YrhL